MPKKLYCHQLQIFVGFPGRQYISSTYHEPMSPNSVRTSLAQGIMKVNNNGSFSTERSSTGIESIFWDHDGRILLYFGKHIIVDSTILVEVLAIRNDLLITAISSWPNSSSFTLESYSLNVASWFSDAFLAL